MVHNDNAKFYVFCRNDDSAKKELRKHLTDHSVDILYECVDDDDHIYTWTLDGHAIQLDGPMVLFRCWADTDEMIMFKLAHTTKTFMYGGCIAFM